MINLDEINGEIEKLENQPTTYGTIERLSWLYTVKDHLSQTRAEKIQGGNSEFRRACAGKPACEVMDVMDELMSVLLTLQPRLYDAVLSKLP